MKILTAALLAAATITTGLAASSAPANAAVRCCCKVIRHHAVHRVVHQRTVYRTRVEVVYEREVQPAPVYETYVYDDDPAYAVGPAWTERTGYDGGPRFRDERVIHDQVFVRPAHFEHFHDHFEHH